MERICSQCHAVLAEGYEGGLVPRVRRRIGGTRGVTCNRRTAPAPLKWIIAALCCRGVTRWAGLLRRSRSAIHTAAPRPGALRAADHDGYSVASSEIPIETRGTITPSMTRGAKGSVSME